MGAFTTPAKSSGLPEAVAKSSGISCITAARLLASQHILLRARPNNPSLCGREFSSNCLYKRSFSTPAPSNRDANVNTAASALEKRNQPVSVARPANSASAIDPDPPVPGMSNFTPSASMIGTNACVQLAQRVSTMRSAKSVSPLL